ncbi:MAG: diguanylate cyclase [Motiliproteus sp.]
MEDSAAIPQWIDMIPYTDSLKGRFLLLTLLVVILTSAASFVVLEWLTDELVERLGRESTVNKVLYERSRAQLPLASELALARKMADSTLLKRWAEDEQNSELKHLALQGLEDYRQLLQDGSYFFANAATGHYYFNNRDDLYRDRQLRYTLNPDDPEHRWFYATLNDPAPYQLNVDYDEELGVLKVWINVVVRQGEQALGVVGTGIDLTHFLKNILSTGQPGITNMFIDSRGAIQAHGDQRLIELRSISRAAEQRRTLFQYFDDDDQQAEFQAALTRLQAAETEVETLFVTIAGQRYLLGTAYVAEIDWFIVTLVEVDSLTGNERVFPVLVLIGCSLLFISVFVVLLLNRLVLNRVLGLELAMRRMREHDYHFDLPAQERLADDEIGRLGRSFKVMADEVRDHTRTLEQQVGERTAELQQLALQDPLTGLLNRRGISDQWLVERNRQQRSRGDLSVLMLDCDNFKQINDCYGHEIGDQVLFKVAQALATNLRSYDTCARWGGEEFLVLLPECNRKAQADVAEKILTAVRLLRFDGAASELRVTISIGGCLVEAEEPFDAVVGRADAALYEAKDDGRDRYQLCQPPQHEQSPDVVHTEVTT